MYKLINNINIHYEIIGSGEPLIMLHGNGEDMNIFNESANILSRDFMVILVDSRCHGKSEDSDISYKAISDDLYKLIDNLLLNKPIFYGFSDGGIVGLMLAINHPSLLKRLIISGANISPKGLNKEVRREIKDEYKRTHDKLLALMLHEPKIKPRELKKIIAPTNILVGENDCILLSETLKIHKSISNSTLEIIPNEGHDSYITHSEKLAKIILKYTK